MYKEPPTDLILLDEAKELLKKDIDFVKNLISKGILSKYRKEQKNLVSKKQVLNLRKMNMI